MLDNGKNRFVLAHGVELASPHRRRTGEEIEREKGRRGERA
jgi:hypothetical protein